MARAYTSGSAKSQANGTSTRSTAPNPQDSRSCSPAPGRPSDTIAAWLSTFSAAARRNEASAQAPGDTFRTPDRDPDASAGAKDPVDLGHRGGCGAPDPAEAGDDVERRRVPRQGVHIADPDVTSGAPVPGHRDQPGRGIDTSAGSPAEAGQFDREPGPARHV